MGLFSGLLRRPRAGVDEFFAALRDKLERDRLLATQASFPNDPAEAMHIRERSQAIDARRAEAKAMAQMARMAARSKNSFRTAEMPSGFALQISSDGDLRVRGGGLGRETMQLAATQEAFERQQDRRIAEERARATGRDPNDSYREMRGWSRQEASPPPAARNSPEPVPQTAAREQEPASAARSTAVLQNPPPALTAPPPRRPGGRLSAQEVESLASRGLRLYDHFISEGLNPGEAAGWAANAMAESDGNYRQPEIGGGSGYGLFQWTHPVRRRDFEQKFGHPIEQSTEAEQLAFRRFELANRFSNVPPHFKSARTPGDYAEIITRHYEIPAQVDQAAADRANIAEAIRAFDIARKGSPGSGSR